MGDLSNNKCTNDYVDNIRLGDTQKNCVTILLIYVCTIISFTILSAGTQKNTRHILFPQAFQSSTPGSLLLVLQSDAQRNSLCLRGRYLAVRVRGISSDPCHPEEIRLRNITVHQITEPGINPDPPVWGCKISADLQSPPDQC